MGCSRSSIARCSIDSVARANSTGRQRSWTRQACGRKGGSLTGPSPVDRGKKGSKIHVLSETNGIPLVVGVTGANTHDSTMLQPLMAAIPGVKSRRGPRRRKPGKLRADKGGRSPLSEDIVNTGS